ncbi:bifunctional ornithine acetyltransferase/N-acetylglutamate synthase [Helicobacter sp.]|uniref:bifunctional ornithine acetyltransferase/N-acetylglutamate synthase n=1 Tax=Helicobacter sp. TaxID=218 RepID=UPI0025B9768B|nr:bifunctional ornithine acetyltransferase/N-acetylglutamate synthase [Helicobacter sp.]MBR2495356.1 bifunctional ornithine acetyltransferase/N-acetylglutamate synthase [Helicobacter sp.]
MPKSLKTPTQKLLKATAKATLAKATAKPQEPNSATRTKLESIKILKSGLNAVPSFQYSGVQAQIKYKKRTDMSLIFSPYPCVGAGVFTTNKVRAACVEYDETVLKSKQPIHAIIANAGNANACTGAQGERACKESAIVAGTILGVESSSVLLASTGVIGVQLPLDRIKKGINLLAQSKSSSRVSAKAAAQGIMTTDLFAKEAAVEFISSNGKRVRLAGIAKGSGMIHPNMATMLCFIITDCAISQKLLQKALQKDVKDSFNMISIDGDTSTNDMTLVLANARARNTPIISQNDSDYTLFTKALSLLTATLARKIARDGEGATKLLVSHCLNAKSKKDARKIAKSVIASSLVKAAMFGNDANWGRILCAVGYSGGDFDPKVVDVKLASNAGEIEIMRSGNAQIIDEKFAKKLLQKDEIHIFIDCKSGKKSAQAYGCDLSYDYVRINADYRS